MANELSELLLNSVRRSRTFEKVLHDLRSAGGGKVLSLKGLRASSFGAVAAALSREFSRPEADKSHRIPLVFIVTANAEHSGEIYDDLEFFGVERISHYPKSETLPYDEDEPLLEEQVKHLDFLQMLAALGSASCGAGTVPVCVTSVEALFTRVPPLEVLRSLTTRVEWGEPFNTEAFVRCAVDLGFVRVPTVEGRGEFAVRGGIVDVFPIDAENPVRIDLFGTDIESMRFFDVHTQRSLKKQPMVESLVILPARERVLLERALGAERDQSKEGPGDPLPTLLDLLPGSALLMLDNPEMFPVLDERFRQLTQRQFTEYSSQRGDLVDPSVLFAGLGDTERAAGRFTQIHHSLILEDPHAHGHTFHTTSFETQKPSIEHYVTQIRKRLADDYTVALICDNEGQAQRMDEMLGENEIGSFVAGSDGTLRGQPGGPSRLPESAPLTGFRDVVIATGLLHSGFVMPEAQLYIITDREIFGRYKRRHVYRKIYKGLPIADAREIRKGDFVVHIDHGIGKFEGIRSQTVDGRTSDFIELVYADGDKLLVPVDKVAYVQKFSGLEQVPPKLDKLGSGRWVQRKRKSQEAIEKLAKDLLELYARRASARGHRYADDSLWQREFEASFLYTETPDQLRAIGEVKQDMMAEKPMDRLVCGDVGYGKTEVAIRAAFKAIEDKKQVALLCPTTVLAQQHLNTFRERFADYPLSVEMLSRFRTGAEVKAVLKRLKAGEVHVVIGTHMLLSKSIQFRELGLVIVDEEQRFGVTHKEKLKKLRTSVDFMTLTATPIPRTLYMALSGLRDMSLINTPPADRHPIKTKIIHFDRDQIEEAILRELNRGGQVYFVHNRVYNIHQVAENVKEIVPSARIAIAHGQMADGDLEQVMLDFIDRKHDILVSTTIIESGLDIPNVNTIIINRADAFGLAQMYQLRGRVGRENRRAYAYLIVPTGQAITEQAVARLAAIEEFTELGVGFNIAMRDMEIRGTGNLLGKEQHGTMCAIGFELYCKLLEEAVQVLRGQCQEEAEREVEIRWKTSAHIPAEFVPVEAQRLMLYRKVAEAKTVEELDDVMAEITDRYGEVGREGASKEGLPEPVEHLLDVARLRILGRGLRIRRIVGMQKGFTLFRDGAVSVFGSSASKLIKDGIPKVFADNPEALEFQYRDWSSRSLLGEAVGVLRRLAAG